MKATRGRERRDALASDGDLFLDLPVSSKQLRDRMHEERSASAAKSYFFPHAFKRSVLRDACEIATVRGRRHRCDSEIKEV